MEYMNTFEMWKNDPYFDEEDRNELCTLTDEKEIEDRFYKDLEFGTAGLRGIMGMGSNRMNKYNVRRASNGFANYLVHKYRSDVYKGVAIAYDTRNNSKDYAMEAALAFASCGVPVYLFNIYSATPLLSFAVRYLGCVGGVVITASHNPKEYNGYKAYDETGCQLSVADSDEVTVFVNKVEITKALTTTAEKAVRAGMLKYIGEDVLGAYVKEVKASVPPMDFVANAKLKVVYTPLHGTGNISVRRVLSESGFSNVTVVKEQEEADGNFPTVSSPNPGNEASLKLAKELGEKINADIVVGSDPDADRTGVLIRRGNEFEFLDGNSIAALLMYYIAERKQMSVGPFFITSIVSGELASEIAKANDITVFKTLTGFKYIGEIMNKFQDDPNMHFVFGCEESYGYLGGEYIRDKCSAYSVLALCSACSYYLKQGKTLGDVMDEIHEKYGFYLDSLDTFVFTGKEGSEKMKSIMTTLRNSSSIFDESYEVKDYSMGIDGLEKSNVIKYIFSDGSWATVRPSGTEPQLKIYFSTKAKTKDEAKSIYENRKAVLQKYFD